MAAGVRFVFHFLMKDKENASSVEAYEKDWRLAVCETFSCDISGGTTSEFLISHLKMCEN